NPFMGDLAPESEYGQRHANPRRAGWMAHGERSPNSRPAAKTSGARWMDRRSDPDLGNPARIVRWAGRQRCAATLLAAPANYTGNAECTRQAAPSRYVYTAYTFRAAPGCGHESDHAPAFVFGHDRRRPSAGNLDIGEAASR